MTDTTGMYIPFPQITGTPTSPSEIELVQLINHLNNHTMPLWHIYLLTLLFSLPYISLDAKLAIYNFLTSPYIPFFSSVHLSTGWFLLLLFLGPVGLLVLLSITFAISIRLISSLIPLMPLPWLQRLLAPEPTVFLQLTFPKDTSKSAYATEQLYTLLHSLASQKRGWIPHLLKQKQTYSLEIVATRGMIRYLISVPEIEKEIIIRSLLAYLPGTRITCVPDYLPASNKSSKTKLFSDKAWTIAELKLSSHPSLPLRRQNVLTEHDPMMYLTGNMTKLKADELVAFQLITTPILTHTHGSYLAKERTLRKQIARGEPILRLLQPHPLTLLLALPGIDILWPIIRTCLLAFSHTVWFTFDMIALLADSSGKPQQMVITHQAVPRQALLNPYEAEVHTLVKEKTDQHLFETSIRLLVVSTSQRECSNRLSGLLASFGPMTSTHQALTTKRSLLPDSLTLKKRMQVFTRRVLSPRSLFQTDPILSSAEIADIYHFPYTNTTETEDLVKLYNQELPTPRSLKRPEELALVFAKNTYGGDETMIGLTAKERERHMAVFGMTGAGKSTMLAMMIEQDIKAGNGCCLIDPHGDLVDGVVGLIPPGRKHDVIWVDPDNLEREIAINLLELTPGLTELESMREKEYIAESIVSLFRTVFSDAWTGSGNPHQIEYMLRNTIYTAFTVPNATLFTIYDLLTNKSFRTDVTKKLTNKRLSQFWKEEFTNAGAMQRVKMMRGVTARIGRFLFSPSASQILDKPHSTINFDEILDTKKILLCKLPLGELGEDTAQLLGMLILHKIQLAALKRARKDKETRTPFYVYVDEFQNFANLSFMKLLAQTRKYGVHLIAAEQTTAQQRDRMLSHMLVANTGTIVTFRLTSPIDGELLLPQFSPYLTKEDLMNVPAFHFYMKKGAITPEEPFSGETIVIDHTPDPQLIQEIIHLSNGKYTLPYKSEARIQTGEQAKKSHEKKSSKKNRARRIIKKGSPKRR